MMKLVNLEPAAALLIALSYWKPDTLTPMQRDELKVIMRRLEMDGRASVVRGIDAPPAS